MAVDFNAAPVRQNLSETLGIAWADQGMGYTVVGGKSAGPLISIVNEMRRQARLLT